MRWIYAWGLNVWSSFMHKDDLLNVVAKLLRPFCVHKQCWMVDVGQVDETVSEHCRTHRHWLTKIPIEIDWAEEWNGTTNNSTQGQRVLQIAWFVQFITTKIYYACRIAVATISYRFFFFFISCSMWVWATLCAKGKCDRTSSVNGANWLTLQQWVVFEHFAGILLALTETRPSNRKKIWQIFRNVLFSDKNYLSCLPSPGGLFYFITNTDSLRWTLKSYTQHWFISKLRAVCAMTHAIIWLVIFALNTIQNSLIGVNNVLVSFFF